MLVVKSKRGGVSISGYNEAGIFEKHTFRKEGDKKKFSHIEPAVVTQAKSVGWYDISGKNGKIPSEKTDDEINGNNEELRVARQKAEVKVEELKTSSVESRFEATNAKAAVERMDKDVDAEVKKLAQQESDDLNELADVEGAAFEEAKKVLAAL